VDIIFGLVMGNLLLAGLIWVANRTIERHDAKKRQRALRVQQALPSRCMRCRF